MIDALIVDDEELARRGLEIRLGAFPDVRVCGQARNGREALELIRSTQPDLVLLDVQMPGMDGFGVLRRLAGSEMPAIVFVTAYNTFAIEAFEARALDYLLKPVDDERLAQALGRVREFVDARRAREHRQRLLELLCHLSGRELTLEAALERPRRDAAWAERIAIRDGSETRLIDLHSIDWIDAAGDYMCLHAGGETHVMRGTMKRLEKLLDPRIFVRVHRSTIVNRHRVTALRAHRNGEYFLRLGEDAELKLSRKYRDNLGRLAERL